MAHLPLRPEAPVERRALEAIARRAPDLVLTDLQMPEVNGLELVEAVPTTIRR